MNAAYREQLRSMLGAQKAYEVLTRLGMDERLAASLLAQMHTQGWLCELAPDNQVEELDSYLADLGIVEE